MEPGGRAWGQMGGEGCAAVQVGALEPDRPAFESQSCRLLASYVPLASHLPSLCLFPDLQPGDDKGVYLIGLL